MSPANDSSFSDMSSVPLAKRTLHFPKSPPLWTHFLLLHHLPNEFSLMDANSVASSSWGACPAVAIAGSDSSNNLISVDSAARK